MVTRGFQARDDRPTATTVVMPEPEPRWKRRARWVLYLIGAVAAVVVAKYGPGAP